MNSITLMYITFTFYNSLFCKIEMKNIFIHSNTFSIVNDYDLNFIRYLLIEFENSFLRKDRAFTDLQYCCTLNLITIMSSY